MAKKKKLQVKSETPNELPVELFVDCPLCEESDEWPFPKDRTNWFGNHFTLGKTWRPAKGHKDFELHEELRYHFKKDGNTT